MSINDILKLMLMLTFIGTEGALKRPWTFDDHPIKSHPHVEVASRSYDPFKAMIHLSRDDLLTLDECLNTGATFILDDLALMWML